MAVYKKTYRPYAGALTPRHTRFLVLTRFALDDMRARRFLPLFFLATMIPPVICVLLIYLHHNVSAMQLMAVNPKQLLPIDSVFFMNFLGVQCMFAYFLTAFIGPGLVSPDVANNALPLYLARPFSRAEYTLGKISVIAILLSAMTWIPGLLLFGLQSFLEGGWWIVDNVRLAVAMLVGSLIWILLLGMLALAISAWVKWKPIAGAMLFGVFFVATGFGAAVNEVLRTKWGHLMNISHLMGSIWIWLFDRPERRGAGAVFFRVHADNATPLWTCWLVLLAIFLICLYALSKKVRGAEVVR